MQARWLMSWVGALVLLAEIVLAAPLEKDVARVLRVDEVVSILRDEGLRYGADVDAEMLAGRGGRYFHDRVDTLYDAGEMGESLKRALSDTLSVEQMKEVIDFFGTEQGQRILALENAGRIAMADPAVEGIARTTYEELDGSDDPHLREVDRFVRINDLIDRNVTSALDANYHFYRGMVDGGGARMDEGEILSQVWAQEAELRMDTISWVYGFLVMAYRPLSRSELRSYADFSETDAGQALNKALFAGFDQIYNDISYGLGLAVAQAMNSRDI